MQFGGVRILSRRVGWVAAALCLGAPAVRAGAEVAAAYVYEIQGDWISGGQRLQRGQGLAEGSVVRPEVRKEPAGARAVAGHIVLMTLDGNPLRLDCCAKPEAPPSLKVPSLAASGAPLTRRVVEAAARVFQRRQELFATTLARGAEDDSRSGMAKVDGNWIELGAEAPRFRRQGVLLLELWLWSEPQASDRVKTRVTLPLPAEETARLPNTPHLLPGLYRAQPMGVIDGKLVEAGRDFYLLLGTDGYADRARAFQASLAIADGWGQRVTPAGKEEFLRACLVDLAGSGEGRAVQ